MKTFKNYLFPILLLTLSFPVFSQYDDEEGETDYGYVDFGDSYYDEEYPQTMNIGANNEFILNKMEKSETYFHYQLTDANGKIIFPAVINQYVALKNGNYFLLLDQSAILVDPNMKMIEYFPFELFQVDQTNLFESKDEFLVFDEKKNSFTPLRELILAKFYDQKFSIVNHGRYSDSSAIVSFQIFPANSRPKYGLLDLENRKVLIEPKYDYIYRLGELYICNLSDEEYSAHVLDRTGKVLADGGFVRPISEENLILRNNSNKYGVLDTQMKEVLPFEFDTLYVRFNSYDESMEEDVFYGGEYGGMERIYHIIGRKNKLLYCYKSSGEPEITKGYQEIQPQVNGFLITENNNYGFLKSDGSPLLPSTFDSIVNFSNHFFVLSNGKWKIFNSVSNDFTSYDFDKFKVIQGEVFSLIKGSTQAVISTKSDLKNVKFEFEDCVSGGYKEVLVKQNGKWGVYTLRNESNSLIVPCTYDDIQMTDGSIYILKKKEKYGIFANDEMVKTCMYDIIYFTLVGDDFGNPYQLYCKKGKKYEIISIANENLWGM